MTTIMDPTDERVPVTRQLSPRPKQITGRVALLDISKPRGALLLDQLEEVLAKQLPGVPLTRYAKPTFSKPAPQTLREEIHQDNDFVIEALAD